MNEPVEVKASMRLRAVEWIARTLFVFGVFVIGVAVGTTMTQKKNEEYVAPTDTSLFPSRLFANRSDILVAASRWSPTVVVVDERYTLPTRDIIGDVLFEDETQLIPYMPESWDCDEYAIEIVAMFRRLGRTLRFPIALGMALGAKEDGENHAINAFFDQHVALWCVEPQTDAIWGCEGFTPSFLLI